MTVTVTDVEMVPGQSVATATGIDEQGRTVIFAGDWRPMQGLADLVDEQGEVEAEIEPWMILSVTPKGA